MEQRSKLGDVVKSPDGRIFTREPGFMSCGKPKSHINLFQVLCHIMQRNMTWCYVTLHNVALHCVALFCFALRGIALNCVALCRVALRHMALCCVASCCSFLHKRSIGKYLYDRYFYTFNYKLHTENMICHAPYWFTWVILNSYNYVAWEKCKSSQLNQRVRHVSRIRHTRHLKHKHLLHKFFLFFLFVRVWLRKNDLLLTVHSQRGLVETGFHHSTILPHLSIKLLLYN